MPLLGLLLLPEPQLGPPVFTPVTVVRFMLQAACLYTKIIRHRVSEISLLADQRVDMFHGPDRGPGPSMSVVHQLLVMVLQM